MQLVEVLQGLVIITGQCIVPHRMHDPSEGLLFIRSQCGWKGGRLRQAAERHIEYRKVQTQALPQLHALLLHQFRLHQHFAGSR